MTSSGVIRSYTWWYVLHDSVEKSRDRKWKNEKAKGTAVVGFARNNTWTSLKVTYCTNIETRGRCR